ncbi:MAG: glycosyltransferase [Deltaproteobacteria bacterium]|nr:glycosyltransferase [Deltaproteobacteria bacterium]
MAVKVCFIGGARYSDPLDATSEKKFRALKTLGELFVIGFSHDLRLRRFTEHAHFYLLPQLSPPVLRYLELFITGEILIIWLIVRHGIQVVITQSPYEGFIAASAIRLARCFGYQVGLVVEVHGDFERSLFLQREIPFSAFYRIVMDHVAHYSIKQADLLRAISNSTKEQLEKWAPEKTIVQFPAWTDIETFLQNGIQIKRNVRDVILYAGVLIPLKGVHHLIKAFVLIAADFPTAELVIIGRDENKAYAAGLREQVKEIGLEGRVQFVRPMSQSELAIWMAEACVLVLPSTSEGLGRVLIEAMAAGTPVVGSRVGGIPEIVEDGARGFLIPPGDENALADKLRWLLHNPDKAREMGEHARAFAERLCSTENYLKAYKQIFEVARPRNGQREHATSTL